MTSKGPFQPKAFCDSVADQCSLLLGQPDQPLGGWEASDSHHATTRGIFVALQQNFSCSCHLSHPFTDTDVTNSWPSALLSSQINTELFRVPFGYLNAAYCSVTLSFRKLAWCTMSNVIFWMLCWKRLFKGVPCKINTLLSGCCELPLQISVADIFLSEILEYLKPMYLLKIHHQKKQDEKT